jgi:hypothetical protein
MPALVVAGIEMLGAALLGAGAGAIGAAVMFYAAEIATVAILAGGLAYSQSQKSKAERAARAAYNAAQVDRLVNVSSSIASRELVMGRVRKGGAIFFKGSVGANNSKFVMCIALAAHEIDAVETIYLNDVPVTLDGSGYVQEEPYRIARLESAQESFAGSSIVLAHVPEAASVVVTRQTNTGSTEPGAQYDSEIIAHTLAGSTVTIGRLAGRHRQLPVHGRHQQGQDPQLPGHQHPDGRRHADQPVSHAVDQCPPGARRGLPDL